MHFNFPILLAATLIHMVLGFIWYNPKIGFGNAWMKASGVNPDMAKNSNMAAIFSLTTLFAFMVALTMQSIVIHQFHVQSLLMTQPDSKLAGSESMQFLKTFMERYGNSYRTFKHGAFHGTLAGLFLALPIVGTNALFEGKGFKYIAINSGYWIVGMALMGGVICAFS